MTDQHPLTNEICEELSSCITILNAGDADPYISPFDVECDMQRAADWQLEQDAEAWKTILNRLEMIPPPVVDSFIEEFKKAMRSTTTQENN